MRQKKELVTCLLNVSQVQGVPEFLWLSSSLALDEKTQYSRNFKQETHG